MVVKEKLVEVAETEKFARVRRKIIVFRSFMQRAYGWIQVPGMVLMLVGVMYPYIKGYININIWLTAFIVLCGLAVIGFVERYLGFFKEDVSYGTEQNRLLLRRLDEIEEKVDHIVQRIEEGKDTKEEVKHERGEEEKEEESH